MRLLLDEHISPAVAGQLRARGVDALPIRDWRGGGYRGASDEHLLTAAVQDERVLVTFDLRTIPTLLKEWAETDRHHAGVVLVDQRTVRPPDVGGLVRALATLATTQAVAEWADVVVFLEADPAA